ncbi:(2Fe-2S)-binding protein [Microvirga sp. 2TAF3]|uniref:(2Fe-2S)-binding protein n=1 Tax=Microvirga sp. 2TAF3 TaxID=3233014 RepID=UPI003F98BABC
MAESSGFRNGVPGRGFSRRNFLLTTASTAAAMPLGGIGDASAQTVTPAPPKNPRQPVDVTLRINNQNHVLALDARTSLLDALRDHIGLTGTKKGCDHGQCGACTVLVNGRRELSCMTFAVMQDGYDITTIEGLVGPGGELHPMQQAFIDHDAFQCGYCTPGQIMSAVACVMEGNAETDAAIREYMSGNICRCAAYPNIVAAIKQARDRMKGI